MTRKEIIRGLEMTTDLILFNSLTGEMSTADRLNGIDKITYDACKGAIEILREQEKTNEHIDKGHEYIEDSITWSNKTAEHTKLYCTNSGYLCEFSTEYGYCQLTACVKRRCKTE